jgi:O-antigen/teichoic acid export membrane protein
VKFSGGTTPVSKRLTAPAHRVLTMTIVDQGASSISNFALALVVAHFSHARELGIFALLTVTYVIVQGVVRGLTSDCLLTRTETDDGLMAQFEQSGYLWAFLSAACLSVVVALASIACSPELRLGLLIFSACFPFMALQDFSRFIGISRHHPEYSIQLDVAWVVLFALSATALLMAGWNGLSWLWASWTISGAAVGIWTVRAHLSLPRRQALLRFWLGSERSLGVRFAGQYLLTSTWIYFIYYPLVLVISVDSVGRIKLAQLALGPITVLMAGVQSGLISVVARRFKANRVNALRFCLIAAVGIAATTVAWTLALYYAPIHLMTDIYGPTWRSARWIYPIIGLSLVCGSFSGIAAAGLRAIRAATPNLMLAAVMLPISFVLCIGGAAEWGARGFSYGLAITYGIYGILGWFTLVRCSRDVDRLAGADPGPIEFSTQQNPGLPLGGPDLMPTSPPSRSS